MRKRSGFRRIRTNSLHCPPDLQQIRGLLRIQLSMQQHQEARPQTIGLVPGIQVPIRRPHAVLPLRTLHNLHRFVRLQEIFRPLGQVSEIFVLHLTGSNLGEEAASAEASLSVIAVLACQHEQERDTVV